MVIGEEGGGGIGKRGSLCYCNIAYTLSNPPYSPNLLWRTSPELQMPPHRKKFQGHLSSTILKNIHTSSSGQIHCLMRNYLSHKYSCAYRIPTCNSGLVCHSNPTDVVVLYHRNFSCTVCPMIIRCIQIAHSSVRKCKPSCLQIELM